MHETFPKLEEDVDKIFEQIIFSACSPIMKDVNKSRLFEGNKSLMRRSDGNEEEINMVEFSSETVIPIEKILYGTIQDMLEYLKPVGVALETEQEKMLLEAADKATEKTGNVVHGKDRTLSHEMILEALEKTQIDFDRDGKPIVSLYVSPSIYGRIQDLVDDPKSVEFEKQYDELMKRKRSEWRAREANRILVG